MFSFLQPYYPFLRHVSTRLRVLPRRGPRVETSDSNPTQFNACMSATLSSATKSPRQAISTSGSHCHDEIECTCFVASQSPADDLPIGDDHLQAAGCSTVSRQSVRLHCPGRLLLTLTCVLSIHRSKATRLAPHLDTHSVSRPVIAPALFVVYIVHIVRILQL